ncbi:MAG: tRNA preQ1(34) S-adenosylmethionine ribosyltransferase-isomerase QueA [Bdellovibrionia bacterium]
MQNTRVSLDQLSAYDYDLPQELIAQAPVTPRDESRLLVLHRSAGRWEHRRFRDLPEYLDSQDFIVANNTKVIRARLLGRRILKAEAPLESQLENQDDRLALMALEPGTKFGGRVEFVLLEELEPRVWEGLFKASGKYVPGFEFWIPTPDGKGIRGQLVRGSSESPSGTVVAQLSRDPVLAGAGELPLPHYIQRESQTESGAALKTQDHESYQTVYAKESGSAAAPTAGLHFTPQVMGALKQKQVSWEELTLHVGMGTFRPVKNPDISQHVMHEERYWIDEAVAARINSWKKAGKRCLAVGTTSVRSLESAWLKAQASGSVGEVQSGPGRTALFIRPGHFEFQVVDRMITNFHLPQSTLLMLVSAFAGRDFVLAAYQEAVAQKYRFFSYGDAMLIL